MKLISSIIAKRLVRAVMVFALVMIIAFTVIIGWETYKHEIKSFEHQIGFIESSYLDVIRESLWVNDQESLKIVLIGICRFPGIAYAHIHSNGAILCEAGTEAGTDALSRTFPIIHNYNGRDIELGKLHIQGDNRFVRANITRAVVTVILTQTVTIFVVCLIILWLFYRLILRRILTITSYTSTLSLDSLGVPLVLDRHGRANDELDDLAVSIDRLTNDLSLAFSRQQIVEDHLKQQSRNLEKAVAARTSSLEIANNQLKQEIEQRKTMEQERERLIADLQKALGDVKQLSGLLPICSHCKKIRDDSGYWNQIESYIREHSGVEFSHGICQDCLKKYYPDYDQ